MDIDHAYILLDFLNPGITAKGRAAIEAFLKISVRLGVSNKNNPIHTNGNLQSMLEPCAGESCDCDKA